MTLRFFRRIRNAPGLRVNLGDHLEACRQSILEREQPAVGEIEEPGLCA
jgi:hypothetical protein